jgi:hypothetical protein
MRFRNDDKWRSYIAAKPTFVFFNFYRSKVKFCFFSIVFCRIKVEIKGMKHNWECTQFESRELLLQILTNFPILFNLISGKYRKHIKFSPSKSIPIQHFMTITQESIQLEFIAILF